MSDAWTSARLVVSNLTILVADILFRLQWSRSPGKAGSHFDPNSDLFVPSEKKDVITSTLCWTAMAALLAGLSFAIGPIQMLKLYGVPYWVIPISCCLYFRFTII